MSTHTDVIADLADAIDPRLTEEQRFAAVERAAAAKPLFALIAICGLAEGMIEGLAAVADVDDLMLSFRQQFALALDELDQP